MRRYPSPYAGAYGAGIAAAELVAFVLMCAGMVGGVSIFF